MRSLLPGLAAALLLSACHASVKIGDDEKDAGDNVHLAMGDAKGNKDHISLDVPGFSAKISLPDMNLGGHMDLDGIKLAPDTDVKSMDITGDDKGSSGDDGSGTVRMEFTNPGTPASLIDYYRKAATDAGYGGVAATATGVSATKEGKQFAMSIAPAAKGSRGAITMTGDGK
jgi:hypothetical protein